VFFKILCGSRTNQEAGLAKQYPQTEEAFYWSLRAADLDLPVKILNTLALLPEARVRCATHGAVPLRGFWVCCWRSKIATHYWLRIMTNFEPRLVDPSKRVSKQSTKARK
jgi:hypothetical protein